MPEPITENSKSISAQLSPNAAGITVALETQTLNQSMDKSQGPAQDFRSKRSTIS